MIAPYGHRRGRGELWEGKGSASKDTVRSHKSHIKKERKKGEARVSKVLLQISST